MTAKTTIQSAFLVCGSKNKGNRGNLYQRLLHYLSSSWVTCFESYYIYLTLFGWVWEALRKILVGGESKVEQCTLSIKLTLSWDPLPTLPLSVKISVKISMLLGIRETCMPFKASMLLLPHPLNVTLTLSVHFSNFDSPLIRRFFKLSFWIDESLWYSFRSFKISF